MSDPRIRFPLFNFSIENKKSIELPNGIIEYIEMAEGLRQNLKYDYELKIDKVGGEEVRRTLDRVMIIFRLYKDNVIWAHHVIMDEKNRLYDYLPHYNPYPNEGRDTTKYSILEDEIENFQKFWENVWDIDYSNFAVNRFNISLYEPYARDKLVNFVEALEYLFVPTSAQGEIGYKLRQAGTIIIGREMDLDQKMELFKFLRLSYNFRSGVVHGDMKQLNKYVKKNGWEGVLGPLRQYTQDSILFFHNKKLLDNKDKRWEFIKENTIIKCPL